MVAVHQHLRLDHRHDLVGLTEGGVAGQGMGVGLDRPPGRNAGGDVDHPPPFGEAGAALVGAGQAVPEAIQALGHRLAREAGQGLGALVHLDAGDGAGGDHEVHQRRAVGGVLPQGLLVEDHPADEVAHGVGGAEQELAVVAPVGLVGVHADGVEPLLDRAGGFVGGQDALAGRHHPAGDFVKRVQIHRPAPTDSNFQRRHPRQPLAFHPF